MHGPLAAAGEAVCGGEVEEATKADGVKGGPYACGVGAKYIEVYEIVEIFR
jgi:hypothetical protein